ncbi:TPA: hypothetical protein N0F65_005157, partial [Lagenidium giganteum]
LVTLDGHEGVSARLLQRAASSAWRPRHRRLLGRRSTAIPTTRVVIETAQVHALRRAASTQALTVSIRCRPFTCDDKLGVVLTQTSEEEGEVQLINSSYSTTRFAFSYAWWSAYGYQRHVQDDPPELAQMTLVDQTMAYDSIGLKIKEDLLTGNAVVMFAYGLSGSGKTFTVFGPDAVDIPEAWFKHEEPHPLWGIFPRLAYDIFKEKQDGWKISMKYFQNVVDTVRDLMSPVAQEQQYKSGMRKDPDGFTDIDWCQSVVLKDWNDLRRTFMSANARKAIAPTQFNHQSTRGHCIMTLEVEKPDPEREGMKQKGRVYVCDLAGTEPAGDIVYADYKKIVYENGELEYKYLGPHPDASKSKELQDQGKKINLSLTEMAQFFMKMAEAVKANKLKPGSSIPGCNSYFLCKYLKDTMLQARTYLFCAIRPEVKFHNYTFSTLGFAKNASVIKLQPKKATAAASPAERKLMAELEQMKMLVGQLKSENERMAKMRGESGAGAGAGGGDTTQMDELSEMLNNKQRELERVLNGESDGSGGGRNAQDEMMQRQREEYGKRGISLYHFENETLSPYLINLDVDAYRSKRFMFLLSPPKTTIGPNGDIKPMSLSVVDDHCWFDNDGENIFVCAGNGEVLHNGRALAKGARELLVPFDRVVIGNEIMLFIYPGREPPEGTEPPTADDAAREYQKAVQAVDNTAMLELQAQMKKFEEEKANWERQKAESAAAGDSAAPVDASDVAEREKELLARQVNDQELREVLPKMVELKQIVKALNRDVLSFETALQSTTGDEKGGIPKVKVKVHNKATDETIFLDVFEFVKAHALLKDEVAFLRNALMNDREYESPAGHDPITLLFDNSFHVGSATTFPEYLLYNLETDADESQLNIKLAVPPFNTIGKLQVVWSPLSSPDPEKHNDDDLADIEGPQDLLGKPWTYKIQIKGATGLPLITDLAYCQYEFLGELFTTESVEQNTRNPNFGFEAIHHVGCVTQSFIDYLQNSRIEFQIFVNPYILDPPKDKISTKNAAIVANLGGQIKVKATYEDLEAKCAQLEAELAQRTRETEHLRQAYRAATGSEDVAHVARKPVDVAASPSASTASSAPPSPAPAPRVPLRVLVASWNVGNAMPPKNKHKISQWVPEGGGGFDVIAVGLQESSYREKSSEADGDGEGDADDADADKERNSDLEDADYEGENTASRGSSIPGLGRQSSARDTDYDDGADDSEVCGDEDDATAGAAATSGGAGSGMANGEVIIKRSRTKKHIRKVSHIVRKMSNNLRETVADALDYPFNKQLFLHLGDNYALVGKVELMEMRLFIYVHIKHNATHLEKMSVPTGLGSVLGNKGGLIFKLCIENTTLCFVSCHLAAHQDQKFLDKRNADCASILNSNFGLRNVSVDFQYDHCFWFGDLNYRVDLHYTTPKERTHEQHFNEVLALVKAKKWAFLNANDQLKHQIQAKKALVGWELPTANFPPTFKRVRHTTDQYNPQRVPSFCDRVLHKSLPGLKNNLKCKKFMCVEDMGTSDHKPVFAEFEVLSSPVVHVNPALAGARTTLVEITELVAKDLPAMDITGTSDPYVSTLASRTVAHAVWEVTFADEKTNFGFEQIKFYSLPAPAMQLDGSSHPSTAVISSSLCPAWRDDQVPQLHLLCDDERDVKGVHLVLLLMDKDHTSMDGVLGVVTVSLEKYCLSRPKFLPFEAEVVQHGKGAGSVSGKLRITLPHQQGDRALDQARSLQQRVPFEHFLEHVAGLSKDEHGADQARTTWHNTSVERLQSSLLPERARDAERAACVLTDSLRLSLHHCLDRIEGLRAVHGHKACEDAADRRCCGLLRHRGRLGVTEHLRAPAVQLVREHRPKRKVAGAPDALAQRRHFKAAEQARHAALR